MTLQEFQPIFEKQQKSSLTQKEFCECYDIAISTFSYWKKKCLHPQETLNQKQANQFIEITNESCFSTTADFEITTPNGYRIKIPKDFHASQIRVLLETIG